MDSIPQNLPVARVPLPRQGPGQEAPPSGQDAFSLENWASQAPLVLVDRLRAEARKSLIDATEPCVELTALTLLERGLAGQPRESVLQPGETHVNGLNPCGRSLAMSGNYTAALALSLAGGPGMCLTPSVLSVLSAFRTDKLFDAPDSYGNICLADPELHSRANRVTGPSSWTSSGVEVGGCWAPLESANLGLTLQQLAERSPRAASSVRTVNVQTMVGFLEGTDLGFGGVSGGAQTITLARHIARDLERCRHFLFHESGHELECALQEKIPARLFGSTEDPLDYVSNYAMTDEGEDFAETHAHLLLDFERIRAFPDLMLHARGKRGEKLAWMLEHGCGKAVGAPSSRLSAALEEIRAGRSPFGFQGRRGEVVAAERDFRATLEGMLKEWSPGQAPPEAWRDAQHPDFSKRSFIVRHFTEHEFPAGPTQARTPALELGQRARALFAQEDYLADLHHATAEKDPESAACLAAMRVRAALRKLEGEPSLSAELRRPLTEVFGQCLPEAKRAALHEHLARGDVYAIKDSLRVQLARNPPPPPPASAPPFVLQYVALRDQIRAGGPELIHAIVGDQVRWGKGSDPLEKYLQQFLEQ